MAFLKDIIDRLTGATPGADRAESPGVHLAAFGKHPGWDDHIDDIGVNTESLVAVKRSLYLQGISGNVDAGTWDQLDAAHRLQRFDHFFIWQGIGSVVAGRLIASADGKGRSRYPMVVCADCGDMEVHDVVERVCPHLTRTLNLCRQTKSQQEVLEIIREAQRELSIVTVAPRPSPGRAAALLADLTKCSELAPDGVKLLLVFYQIQREMGQYTQDESSNRTLHRAAAQLRVPACAAEPAIAVQRWLQLVSERIAVATPTLGIAAVEGGWVDLIVGETQIQDFYCLQASRATIPYATDIPYSMDAEFTAAASRDLDRYRAG